MSEGAVTVKAAPVPTVGGAGAKQAPAAWYDEAQGAIARVLKSFEAAVAGLESLGASTPADASVLINKAKASIIDIDLAARNAVGNQALPKIANQAITDIYSSLTRAMPHGVTSKPTGWVSSLPSHDRKNLASYQALGALVSKLTS